MVFTDTPVTFRPQWRADTTSGTTDMPTTSAPRRPIMRISAAVSKFGPGYAMKTPSCSLMPFASAVSLTMERMSAS